MRRAAAPIALTAVAVLTLATGCSTGGGGEGGGGEEAGQVVFATYTGPTSEGFQEAYFDDFTADTGIEVVQVPADMARYVSMAESGSSEWDSIDADGYAVADWVNRDLVQKYASDVPKADMVDEKYQDYIAGGYTQSFVLAYRASAFDEAPQGWADFWDVDKFPGKRGLPGFYVGTIEAALIADGVPLDEVYPLDFDRGFAKLDELRPNATVYESYSALTQALQAGSVDMAILPSGRATGLSQQDPDFVVQWNENIFYPYTGFSISIAAPNPEAMSKLGHYLNDPERQARFAELTFYGPTIESAYDLLDDDVLALLPGTEEHRANAATVNTEVLAEQNTEYNERYTEWLAQ